MYQLQTGNQQLELKKLSDLPKSYSTSYTKTCFGSILTVEVSSEISLYNYPFTFKFLLDKNYPKQPPKLLCDSFISYPSPSDGRDLMQEFQNRKQTSSVSINQIITKLPTLIKFILTEKLGKPYYKEGSALPLSEWEGKQRMGLFYAFCQGKRLVLVVTHKGVLELSLDKNFPGVGFVSEFHDFSTLVSFRKRRNNKIILSWREKIGKEAIIDTFIMKNSHAFIQVLKSNIEFCGVNFNRKISQKHFLTPEEVTGVRTSNIDIQRIQEQIQAIQQTSNAFQEIRYINRLMELYQKAVQYYSALSHPNFQVVLGKMKEFLSNKDVQWTLQYQKDKKQEQNICREQEKCFIEQERKQKKYQVLPRVSRISSQEHFMKKYQIPIKRQEIQEQKIENKLYGFYRNPRQNRVNIEDLPPLIEFRDGNLKRNQGELTLQMEDCQVLMQNTTCEQEYEEESELEVQMKREKSSLKILGGSKEIFSNS